MTMAAYARSGTKNRTDGFIIVAVLWILGALATLASVYAFYVANTAVALAINDDRMQAEALIAAGVELAVYQMSVAPESSTTRQIGDSFRFRLGGANVVVTYQPENARIDLNAAPKTLLAGLFRTLGAPADNADNYADRVIAWRTAPSRDSADSEASFYRSAGLNYGPRGAPFAHAGELWLVAGLPPAFIERAMPFVTVYSGQADVNITAAAPVIVASLPGMTSERLDSLLNRSAKSSPGGAPTARPATASGVNKTSRITVQLEFVNGRRTSAEVIILTIQNGKDPYRILSWRDDFDGPPSDARARTSMQ
jgi:general secretion pathway protein K